MHRHRYPNELIRWGFPSRKGQRWADRWPVRTQRNRSPYWGWTLPVDRRLWTGLKRPAVSAGRLIDAKIRKPAHTDAPMMTSW